MLQRPSGFTLIELLLVIAILLSLGTFSTVFFSRFMTQSAVSNAQDQLVNQLRKSQLYAMMGRQNGNWGVRFGSNTLTLFSGNSYASRNSAFDETFSFSANISILGFSEVVFARLTGTPSATGTFTIVGNDATASAYLNAMGVVSR